MKDNFVFTESYKCGKILKYCLKTYHKYHDVPITIYGTPEDFKEIEANNNNIFVDISQKKHIIDAYQHGHMGTAHIFSTAILNNINSNIIHIDSDTIFNGECINLIVDKLNEGYDLVGTCRPYKYNPCNRNDVCELPDVIQTYCMGVNPLKISDKYSYNEIVSMCRGACPKHRPIIDFFDPVSFDIIDNNGKIFILPSEIYGGWSTDGSKDVHPYEANKYCDVGKSIIHFAGVGSGYRFFNEKTLDVDSNYKLWAMKRYAIYYKLMIDDSSFIGKEMEDEYNALLKHIREITNERSE